MQFPRVDFSWWSKQTSRRHHHSACETASPTLSHNEEYKDDFSDSRPDNEMGAHTLPRRPSRLAILIPWVLSFIFMATTCLLYKRQGCGALRWVGTTADVSRPTDFKSARDQIELEIKTFTGSPIYDDNGTYYVKNPDYRPFVGPPSPEIDESWEEITSDRYFRITREEAIEAFGNQIDVDAYWSDRNGGYVVGLDMFHGLHCLNRLRQAFWPEYYPETPHPNHIIHREHCIDQIRQLLMCHGDMTVIPTKWSNYLQRNYVYSDVPHTCRNFDKIKKWMHERRSGSLMVPESPVKKHQQLRE